MKTGVQELGEAWRRIEAEAPASYEQRVKEQRTQERKTVLKGLSPRRKTEPKEIGCPAVDQFNRSKRGRRVNKKMDRVRWISDAADSYWIYDSYRDVAGGILISIL